MARERDAWEVSEIVRLTRPEAPEGDPEAFTAQLKRPRTVVLVAEHDHQVVGYLVYDHSNPMIVVKGLAIAPEYRGSGVAAELGQALLKKLNNEQTGVEIELPKNLKDEAADLVRLQFDSQGEVGNLLRLKFNHLQRRKSPPSKLRGQTFYERLDLPEDATPLEIRRAYERRKAAHAKVPSSLALLEEAYQTLSSPEKRDRYDEKSAFFPGLATISPDTVKPDPHRAETVSRVSKPKNHNLYERLGVPANAGYEMIEAAYWNLLGDSNTKEVQRNLDVAFSILGRKDLREKYDQFLSETNGRMNQKIRQLMDNAPPELPGTTERLGFNPLALDPYELLGVSKSAENDAIEAAYRRAWSKANDSPGLQDRLDKAHHILTNPELRAYFDQTVSSLPAAERRRVMNEMWFNPAKFETPDEVRPSSGSDLLAEPPIKPPQEVAPAPAPHRGPPANPAAADLYERLGVAPSASPEEIKQAFFLQSANHRTFPYLLSKLTDAFFVLTDPTYRAQYDRLRSTFNVVGRPLEKGTEINSFVRLCELERLVGSTGPRSTLKKFLKDSSTSLSYLGGSPSLAKRFLQTVDLLYEAAAQGPKWDLRSELVFLEALHKVASQFPDKESFDEIHSQEALLRTRVIKQALGIHAGDAEALDTLLSRYLQFRPPDLLSAELRQKRDALRPVLPLPKKTGAACDGLDAL